MTAFLQWAGTVCMAAAGCTVLHMLVEKNGTGKLFRLLTATFFLCAVLSILPHVKDRLHDLSQLSVPSTDMTALQTLAVKQIKEQTEQTLLQTVNTALSSYHLQAEKVEVEMDTLEDGSISITDIAVYIQPKNDLRYTTVKQVAEQRLGMEVTVRYVN